VEIMPPPQIIANKRSSPSNAHVCLPASRKTAWLFMNNQNAAVEKRYIFSLHKKFMNLESVNVPEYGLRRLTVQRKKKGEGYFTFPCVLCTVALLPGLGEVFPPIPSQNSAIWKKIPLFFRLFVVM
jgi:hypothetical protein